MAKLKPEERRQVGSLACACGQTALIFQNKRDHLYTACPACGVDQRNGAAVQSEWFRRMLPLPGVECRRPPNAAPEKEPIGMTDPTPEPAPAIAPEKPAQTVMESRSSPETTTSGEPIGAATTAEPKSGGLVALAIVGLAAGLGLLFSSLAGARTV